MSRFVMVPVAPMQKRASFPSLNKILEDFISQNSLPSEPKTVVETESRGLLVHLDNGDTFNLYDLEDDLSAYDHQLYGLQGRIDGVSIYLSGGIEIPTRSESHGKKLQKRIYRSDHNTSFIFLGVQTKPKKSSKEEYLFARTD
jgi:hypothetical protein